MLVGGGDPTLTAQPDGKGYYPGGPKLSDLVDQIRAAQIPVDSIVVDTSLYSGPAMARGWDPIDIPGGSIAPIEPLMLDGGGSTRWSNTRPVPIRPASMSAVGSRPNSV